MAKINYANHRFNKMGLAIIQVANSIIREYQEQGFNLTLRQLYYQFVSKEIIPNTPKMYKTLGDTISNARMAGLVDWSAIVDRTRELRGVTHWNTPEEIVEAAAQSFKVDKWVGQETRPEVWIEKDALVGVFEGVCRSLDVDYFSCRGYTSQSEMWEAGRRIFKRFNETGQTTTILHFGDHDPSGIDMSRDIWDRLKVFIEGDPDGYGTLVDEVMNFKRVALHMDQVKGLKLPPNPAKIEDPRSSQYISRFGDKSWELDALDPKVLVGFVKKHVAECVSDLDAMKKRGAEETKGQGRIRTAAKRGL